MTNEQALAYWFGHINYEVRTPQADDLKLDRMRDLVRALGDPQRHLRLVHIAGSKGKGSTSAMLAAVLRQAGYRVGLFTSPHLCRVEERIQVDGVSIAPEELTALIVDVRAAIEGKAAGRERPASLAAPTFFEIATALGFLHFARRRVDVAILEVGLGGRFDSTNVCQPMLALLTSISFDHTLQLGDTLAKIAREKAGIVKPGVPAVSGVTAPAACPVIETICRERGVPLRQLGKDFHYTYEPARITAATERWPRVRIRTEQREWPAMDLKLLGEHQAANAAVAVAAVEQLRQAGFHIPDAAVAEGLARVCWPARLEVLESRPFVVLDCAHNIASAQALVDTLLVSFPPARRLLLFAGSSDKDLTGMFRVLAPHFAHVFLTRYGNSPRGVPPEKLAELLQAVAAIPTTLCPTVKDAWIQARSLADPDDLICITGSVFLAGEFRALRSFIGNRR